jgi:putative transposase
MTSWLRLSRREEAWKTAEILILRHQLAVLQRQQPRRPDLDRADRALLATLLTVIPEAQRQALRLLSPRTRSCAGPRESRLGYRTIHGELAGLGVKTAAPAVREILNKAGMDPAPRRTAPAWPQFLRSQAEAILACGFFTAELPDGTQAYVLAGSSTPPGTSASSESPCIQPGNGPPSRPGT